MAVRTIPVLLAAAGLVTSVSAVAVGLGEIRLQSTINQPLSAEIDLLSVDGQEAGLLRARLGSPEDFARAGLQRPHFLTDLGFQTVLDGTGNVVLKVTSSQSIREPFLDFLVRLEWPEGQLLRAYTLLLDLPEQGGQPALAQRSGPATFDDASTPRQAPEISLLRRPAIAPGSGSYTVQRGDTLWSVASRARPRGVTVQQTLLAIYRQNPDAFIDGDMNRMLRDYPLRMPESSEIAAIDAGEALATVWREAGGMMPTALGSAGAPAEPEAVESGSIEGAAAEDRLRLATPRPEAPSPSDEAVAPAATSPGTVADEGSGQPDTRSAQSPETGGAGSAEWAAHTAERLLYLEEEVLLTRRENRELHERIGNLEEQLGVMSQLIELQDEPPVANQPPAPLPVDVAVADQGLGSKMLMGLGGLAALLLGGAVVRKRRQQKREELAPPELFMARDGVPPANRDSVPDEAGRAAGTVDAPDGSVVALAGTGPASAPDQVPEALETAASPEDEPAALEAFPVPEEARSLAAVAAVENGLAATSEVSASLQETGFVQETELLHEMAPLEISWDEISATEAPALDDAEPGTSLDEMAALDAFPDEAVVHELAGNDADPADNWLSIDFESSADRVDDSAEPVVATSVERAGLSVGESARADDDLSSVRWLTDLAEESPGGEAGGLDFVAGASDDARDHAAARISDNDDYRRVTTFDLDFATFADGDDALTQRDPLQTRLELARVYIDMQDSQSAREILEELSEAVNEDIRRDARELLHSLG